MAIFVKTPQLSPVKTRLWSGIGRRRAEALYLVSAEAVASVAQSACAHCPLQAYWAVAEPAALHTDAWLDLPHVSQGSGSLGERMARVYRLLRRRHRAAVLIGADAPQLTVDGLREAAYWLASVESRLVIGRAEDGGFWLFGANTPLADRAWTSVQYSASDTATNFIRAMQAAGRWRELPMLRDFDTVADIPPLAASLARLSTPTQAQVRLASWLGELTCGETLA